MGIADAIILGVVEGITEFLPISSTAHLEMVSNILGLPQTDFLKSFQIAIQLGAILAVVILYFNVLIKNRVLWLKIGYAFLPTAVVGFVLYKIIKTYLLGNSWLIVATLLLGGILLIWLEKRGYGESSIESIENVPNKKSFAIGVAQALAVIPGVSRSAATIVAGRLLGVKRGVIVEFSFLLAIPTMLAATSFDLLKSAGGFYGVEWDLLSIGFLAAFISALFAVKFFISYIQKHSFASFGVYRIVVAGLFAAFLLFS